MLGCDEFWESSSSNVANSCSESVLCIRTEAAPSCANCRKPSLPYRSEIDDCLLSAAACLYFFSTTVLFSRIPRPVPFWWPLLRPTPIRPPLYHRRGHGFLFSLGGYSFCCKNVRSMYTAIITASCRDDVLLLPSSFRAAKVVMLVSMLLIYYQNHTGIMFMGIIKALQYPDTMLQQMSRMTLMTHVQLWYQAFT